VTASRISPACTWVGGNTAVPLHFFICSLRRRIVLGRVEIQRFHLLGVDYIRDSPVLHLSVESGVPLSSD
jgi:hypothetical protein